MATKTKMVRVPIRLGGAQLEAMRALSQLSGHSVSTVTSVCVSIGFLKEAAEAAVGVEAARRFGLTLKKRSKR